jgi:hypothetical protein
MQHGGADSVRDYFISMADGSGFETIEKMYTRLFHNGETMSDMGIHVESDEVVMENIAGNTQFMEHTIASEVEILQSVWTLFLSAITNKALTLLHQSHSFPGLFALLLSPHEAIRRLGLEKAHRIHIGATHQQRSTQQHSTHQHSPEHAPL